ncbi:hypothetical protein B0H14DRAFT_3531490 [Mycena olivaceomarginata]|nr:hypothetical protein B0H14DRAFT_3531490 [Mycena olivaceomarginata]
MAELPAKVTIMKGVFPDLSAATYQIHDESHTIGNALRWMLMKMYTRLQYLPSPCLPSKSVLRLFRVAYGAPLSARAFTCKHRFHPLDAYMVLQNCRVWREPRSALLCRHERLPPNVVLPSGCLYGAVSLLRHSVVITSSNVVAVRSAIISSLSALITALADLDALCATIQDRSVKTVVLSYSKLLEVALAFT